MGAVWRAHDEVLDRPVAVKELFTIAELGDRGDVTGRVLRECLAHDVAVYPAGSGPVQDAIMLGPPFVIEHAEVEQLVEVLARAITTVTSVLH